MKGRPQTNHERDRERGRQPCSFPAGQRVCLSKFCSSFSLRSILSLQDRPVVVLLAHRMPRLSPQVPPTLPPMTFVESRCKNTADRPRPRQTFPPQRSSLFSVSGVQMLRPPSVTKTEDLCLNFLFFLHIKSSLNSSLPERRTSIRIQNEERGCECQWQLFKVQWRRKGRRDEGEELGSWCQSNFWMACYIQSGDCGAVGKDLKDVCVDLHAVDAQTQAQLQLRSASKPGRGGA